MKPQVPKFGKRAKKQKKSEQEKYTAETPLSEIRQAMIQDAMQQGKNKVSGLVKTNRDCRSQPPRMSNSS